MVQKMVNTFFLLLGGSKKYIYFLPKGSPFVGKKAASSIHRPLEMAEKSKLKSVRNSARLCLLILKDSRVANTQGAY